MEEGKIILHQRIREMQRQEMERKCVGKSPQEQKWLHQEYDKLIESDKRMYRKRAKEIEKQLNATRKGQKYKVVVQTNSPIFLASMENGQMKTSTKSSRRKKSSQGCTCQCEACLAGQHEYCEHDCELW